MTTTDQPTIPRTFWNEDERRWNTHAAFETVNHRHVDALGSDGDLYELLVVECKDGRWYLEEVVAGDFEGHADIFNPRDPSAFPTFFTSSEAAETRAREVVAAVSGIGVGKVQVTG